MSLPPNIAKAFERLRAAPTDAPQDGPDLRWAHRIMERHKRGESVKSATLAMAREALAANGITAEPTQKGDGDDPFE